MILIKMCVHTNKILFASNGIMQCLVYFCATNFEKVIFISCIFLIILNHILNDNIEYY